MLQWNGKDANRAEKAKGLEVLNAIKDDERGGKAETSVVEQGKEPGDFWEALGGQPGGEGTVPVAQLGSVMGNLFDGQATEEGDGVNFDEFSAALTDIGAAVVDDAEFVQLCGQ